MNKLLKSIACVATGLAMAIGVGAGLGKEAREVAADGPETIVFSQLGYSNGDSVSSISSTHFDVNFTDGSTATAYYNTGAGVRVYGGGSFTVSPKSGFKITAATMTFSGTSNAPGASQTVNVGTLSDLGTASVGWTGNTTDGFTLVRPTGSGHWRFQSISVTYGAATNVTQTTTTVTAANNKTSLDASLSPADTVQLAATVDYDGGSISNPQIAWSGNNNSVATISSSGLVTAVGKGSATFTAYYAGNDTYNASSGTIVINVSNPNEITFAGGTDVGSTTASGTPDEMTKGDITISGTNSAFATPEYRLYASSTTTISRASGKIASIVFTKASNSDHPLSSLSLVAGSTGAYDNGIWTGAASSVSFLASSQVRVSEIVVTYYTGADADLDKDSLVLTVGGAASSVSVSSVNGITNPTYDWSITDGDDCLTLSNTTSSTVSVSPKGSKFAVCTLSVSIDGTNLQSPLTRSVSVSVARKSSEGNPFDISEAKHAIDLGDSLYTSEAYVRGIVSSVDKYDDAHYSITYWISDDGATNEIEVYSGKGLNGDNFSSINDVLMGAEVIVFGSLTNYKGTYEFAMNNKLISYIAPTVVLSSISVEGDFATDFGLNDEFVFGGSVIAEYSNGATEDVTSEATFAGYNMSSSGEQTITVSYTEEDVTKTTTYNIVVSSDPSIRFDLYSKNTLTEGDYVIYYNGYVLKAAISNNRAQYRNLVPSDNALFSHYSDVIWHIAFDGDYYTLFNASTEMYLASTGSNNQAKLEANVTDNSRWTVSSSNGAFEFVNKARSSGTNKYLRNNGTYGFACYAENTGGPLTLYKKITARDYLSSASTVVTLNGVESGEGEQTTVSSVALKFGAKIPQADFEAIKTKWGVADYGVMLIKAAASYVPEHPSSFVQELFLGSGQKPLVVNKGTYADPYLSDGYYAFNVKINISANADLGLAYYAVPFICVGSEYIFLEEVSGSINTFATDNSIETNLTANGLNYLATH